MLRTTRRLPRETLQLECYAGVDGQGLPDYDEAIPFEANVLEYDVALVSRGSAFVVASDGSRVETPLTIYVAGDEAEVPDERDRITLDTRAFIVVERTAGRGLRNRRDEPDHYRLRCRKE